MVILVKCTADKDVGGCAGNVFPGTCNKQAMKLGQRESVCVCSGHGSVSPGLALMASQLCPILQGSVEYAVYPPSLETGLPTHFPRVWGEWSD